MFRQEEIIFGGWSDKTVEAMQKRRFDQLVSQLPPLGADALESLSPSALAARLERCWQDIERKPMRVQQLALIWKQVLGCLDIEADCLSREEHELVERALILGGYAQIEDAAELEAARALSLRLWAHVGLVSGKPCMELERPIIEPAAKAFARDQHDRVRARLEHFRMQLSGMLYLHGALDDRVPQKMLLEDVLCGLGDIESLIPLSRRYLWASYDCVDYAGGVLLVHPALAEPGGVFAGRGRKRWAPDSRDVPCMYTDILPEEIPLQRELEMAIAGAMRSGHAESDTARSIRFLCKQGAPLSALEERLQASLIVHISPAMRIALQRMHDLSPKWIESADSFMLQ